MYLTIPRAVSVEERLKYNSAWIGSKTSVLESGDSCRKHNCWNLLVSCTVWILFCDHPKQASWQTCFNISWCGHFLGQDHRVKNKSVHCCWLMFGAHTHTWCNHAKSFIVWQRLLTQLIFSRWILLKLLTTSRHWRVQRQKLWIEIFNTCPIHFLCTKHVPLEWSILKNSSLIRKNQPLKKQGE